MKDILELHDALRSAGLDISGVSGTGLDATINGWNKEPTKQELALADSIIKSFDWSDRVPPTKEELKTRIDALAVDKRQTLLDELLLTFVGKDPSILERINVAESGILRNPR